MDLSCNVHQTIMADVDQYRMGRVLANLLNNSIQAMPKDGGKVSVDMSAQSDKTLLIKVKDAGHGIDSEGLPRIFDAFFTKGKNHGTGLGLAYCKQVVEAHGGTIEVKSEVGKGTEFIIRIPNCVVGGRTPSISNAHGGIKYYGKRFIVADDDVGVRSILRKVIEDGGGIVVWESSSPDDILSGDHPDPGSIDAAIVDYKFEGFDRTGIDIIEYMKGIGLSEVHLCTGFADDEGIGSAALAAGATSVVGKDFL